ncbi:MAG: bis(5'-nucleosyl)-tetraphosphatase (symmetrical) YqeK [Olegusella sp.]|nr:bis(5'-nucleosyl)-tetraphosphatase (symmetrical) YqeK [Olegusella sp.]
MGKHRDKKGGMAKSPVYTKYQLDEIDRLETALADHMEQAKPRRYAHSLSVAKTAESLAMVYGADPYQARCAGILHDWCKVANNEEQMRRASELGIDLGVEMRLVANLLHGIIAARELPARFPELPAEVWQAIERHTTGAADMSPLDMVLFVADGIEPLRPSTPGIEKTRAMVGKASLDELYWESFTGGIVYVLETGRYLYPGTLEIYNAHALAGTKPRGGV